MATMGQRREGITRAYLGVWGGKARRRERRIDRARRRYAVEREIEREQMREDRRR